MTEACRVAVARAAEASYPSTPPFDPDTDFPEYPWGPAACGGPNHAYSAVRSALVALGLDRGNLGTPAWNPLGEVVRSGDMVLLKPNLVCEAREGHPDQYEQIVTSASVVRAVLDYVLIALAGKGRVVIADSPQTDSDFGLTAQRTGLAGMVEAVRARARVPVDLLDLRTERWIVRDGVCTGSVTLPGDPAGYVRADLGRASHFEGSSGSSSFYGAAYDTGVTNRSHSAGRHVYEVSGMALSADVVINIPKLKTHKKCGMTGCLKGMVGLAGNKNMLPHYRFGPPSEGGDQFPDGRRGGRIENLAVKAAKRIVLRGGRVAGVAARALKPLGYGIFGSTSEVIRSGNWHGNDTTWRMVLDLAAIITFCDRSGTPGRSMRRRFFNVVDGIVGGQGNGPLDADPAPSSVVLAGFSPLAVDAVSAAAAGFDPMSIPLLKGGFESPWGFAPCPPEGVETVFEGDGAIITGFGSFPPVFEFEKHFGWRRRRESR